VGGSRAWSRGPGEGIPGIILAAGKGTRMKAAEPKATAQVGGKPMAARVVEAMRTAGITRIIVVVGHRGEEVRAALGEDVSYVVQEEQLGTGHATMQAQSALAGYQGPVVVAHGDIPLLCGEDLARLVEHHLEAGAAATLLTAVFDEPKLLGRILRGEDGRIQGIVEARDATPEQLAMKEINVAVYCFQAPLLFEMLAEVGNDNAQGQYYLTDTIGLLVRRGEPVHAVVMEQAHHGLGVDTQDDLARARGLSCGV